MGKTKKTDAGWLIWRALRDTEIRSISSRLQERQDQKRTIEHLRNKRAMMALDRSPELRLAMKMMASVEWELPIKVFLLICFSSDGQFVQRNKTILEILVGHSRNISMKLFLKWAIGLQEDVFCFLFFFFFFFSSGGHFIQRSRMILVFCFLFCFFF